MRRGSAFAFAFVTLLAGGARADTLAPGYKTVKLSIHVEADVPSDRALILAHTFRAIDVIKPGAVAQVEWHPMGGQMVITSVPASSLTDKVEEQRKSLEREPLEAIAKAGKPCHGGFDGIRSVPISAPADEVRWNYKVTFSAEGCTATLTGMEFFDKAGTPVAGTDVPNVPATAATAAPTGAPSPVTSASAPPGEAQKGAFGCAIGPGAAADSGPGGLARGGAGAGLLAGLGLFLAARRRRRGARASRMP